VAPAPTSQVWWLVACPCHVGEWGELRNVPPATVLARQVIKRFAVCCWCVLDPRSRGATQTHHLEPRPLKANVSCLVFPLHQGKMSSAQPLVGTLSDLDSPSQGSRGQLTSTPPYHSPPSLSPFTIGKAARTHPALAIFSLYLPWLSNC
jgi:hypothetical protein